MDKNRNEKERDDENRMKKTREFKNAFRSTVIGRSKM